MARRMRKRAAVAVVFYAVVTAAIVAGFAWQMAHGICPVP